MNNIPKLVITCIAVVWAVVITIMYCWLLRELFMIADRYHNAMATSLVILGAELPIATILNLYFSNREEPNDE